MFKEYALTHHLTTSSEYYNYKKLKCWWGDLVSFDRIEEFYSI